MRLGAPEGVEVAAAVSNIRPQDCSFDEPMVLGVVMGIGTERTRKATVVVPNWKQACQSAHKALLRIHPGKGTEPDYLKSLADGTFRPAYPTWTLADSETAVFIWPKRYYDDYLRRLAAGTAAPIPGYEKDAA